MTDDSTRPAPSRRHLLAAGGAGIALLALAAPAFGTAAPRRAMVSLTYDDNLDSQLDHAVPQLDAAGLRGSFYLIEDDAKGRADDWRAAARRGHELGNHTVHHPCDLAPFAPRDFISREIAPNERFLDRLAGRHRLRTYAYPCDVTNLGPGTANQQAHLYSRLLRAAGIRGARTSEGAPNNPLHVPATRYRLQALAVGYNALDLAAVTDYLDTAIRRGHWAILVFHEIVAVHAGDGDTTIERHQAVLDAIKARDIDCLPMGAALDRILHRA